MLSVVFVAMIAAAGAIIRYRKALHMALLLSQHERACRRLATLYRIALLCSDSDYPHALREIRHYEHLRTYLYDTYVTVAQGK